MSNSPLDYLLHILEECNFILGTIPEDFSFDDFMDDEARKRAVVRSLEIIGEASKRIPVDFKLKWNDIQWKQMAGMRDRLIHDYFGVDYLIVWDVIRNKIPALRDSIQGIINQHN